MTHTHIQHTHTGERQTERQTGRLAPVHTARGTLTEISSEHSPVNAVRRSSSQT